MRRLILPVLSGIVLLFAFASAAAAEPPVVVTGQTPQVNSGYCSFPVYRSDVFTLTTITKPDGTRLSADVVFFDPERDVAVLYASGYNVAGVTFGPAQRGTQGAVIGFSSVVSGSVQRIGSCSRV